MPVLIPRKRDSSEILPLVGLWLMMAVCCALPLLWMIAQIAANPQAIAELKLSGFRARSPSRR